MEIKINEKLLDEKLGELEKAKQWSPRTISKLETQIRSGDDLSLFRMNPVKFGIEKNIPENEVMDLFLFGNKVRLFEMNWNLTCPGCGGNVESFKTLKALHSHFYCNLCHQDTEASLDDYIQVTFTISSDIRETIFHNPDSLSIEDFFFKYHFNRDGRKLSGRIFVDEVLESLPKQGKILSYINPNEKKKFEFDIEEGYLSGFDVIGGADFLLEVKGKPKQDAQLLNLKIIDRKFEYQINDFSPGRVVCEIENTTNKRSAFLLFNPPPLPYDFKFVPLDFGSFLSGKRLLTTQTFRDLFRSEVIQGTEGIGVRDITVLFTDLKGSTALYDRIGDLKAFNLVRQHFDSLAKVVANNSGAVVKTIGDAVMATFLNPVDAVKSTIEMLKEIEEFNKGFKNRDIILKIGIHKGASIAVTLNDRLDYFGQTVNIASRVQGLADADEIYVTDDVYNYPRVRDLLKDFNIVPDKARLKGVQEEMKVYKITDKMREETKVSEVKSVAKAKKLKVRKSKVTNKRKKKVAV
jgi:class 3 adenylate cyclase